MRGARRWLVGGALLLLAAVGAACVPAARTDGGVARVAVDVGFLEWSDCGDGLDCATLVVPFDHDRPDDGRTFALPVIRARATSVGRVGAVVLNPGGPGGSGVDLVRSIAGTEGIAELNERFDLVGFDPRGVRGSEPAIRCVPDGYDDEIDTFGPGGLDRAGFAAAIVADRAACVDANRALLDHVGTNDVARDLDLLREALGEEQLTYLGFSYGTRIGMAYAALFPDRYRAMALDGADFPTTLVSRSVAEQYLGFEAAFDAFAAWCDDTDECSASRTGGAERTFRRVEERLRVDGPIPIVDSVRVVTPGELYLGVIAGLYGEDGWPLVGRALARAAEGEGSLLQWLADSLVDRRTDGTYENTMEANVAVNCADDAERPTIDDALDRGIELAARLPRFGPLGAGAFTDCVGWPPSSDPVRNPGGAAATPVLVVGTTGDPATPYAWAEAMTGAIGNAVVLTNDAEGHTSYFSSTCVRAAVDAYLLSAAFPASTRCG